VLQFARRPRNKVIIANKNSPQNNCALLQKSRKFFIFILPAILPARAWFGINALNKNLYERDI
jgi:hypothetical protein